MEILIWIAVAIVLIPTGIVVLECFVGCLPLKLSTEPTQGRRCRLVVLMPAHNESAVLHETLVSVMPQLTAGDRLLVIADNCSDDTAEIARAAGAQVLERFNNEFRGKSYALAFGVDSMRDDPPEAVVVIDADCQLQTGALDILAKTVARLDKPVQGLYLMHAGKESSVKVKIAAFAWIIKNQVRALGQSRLGMPCLLMGSGMAFPWHIISRTNLAISALAEDYTIGGSLVAVGHAPVFCPAACVTSEFPSTDQVAYIQHRRWEHGHLNMIFGYLPELLKAVLKRGDLKGVFFVFDMMVPPLALQSMLMMFALCITGLAAGNGYLAPFQAMLGGSVLFGLALMLGWYRYARKVISFKDALQIPVYVISKMSVYVSYIFSREKHWVKTKR
jgi:glycosyltransferase involved in cell wall biosynthesis